jgi:hypothetical protein
VFAKEKHLSIQIHRVSVSIRFLVLSELYSLYPSAVSRALAISSQLAHFLMAVRRLQRLSGGVTIEAPGSMHS